MSDVCWEDYEKMAMRMAWGKVRKNPRLDFEDLMGQAHVAFCIAREKWDPDKGRFSTLFHWQLMDQMGKQAIKQLGHMPIEEALGVMDEQPSPEERASFLQEVECRLSDEAKIMVRMILGSPAELANWTFKTTVRVTKTTIAQYFRAAGWRHQAIQSCFNEIRSMLQAL